MARIIRLTESELTGLIKNVLKKNENSSSIETEIKNKISKINNVDEANSYLSELNDKYAPKSTKLVLIFPGYGQYNIVASMIYISRINAQVFTSINDCIKVINDLSSKGKSYEQIYIGSHGGGQEGLLYSIDEEDNSSVLGGLVSALSKITIPNKTKIMFSACNAADSTGWYMKRIAELTNSFVYASEGYYDWVNNKSEKGFWLCPPIPKVTGILQGLLDDEGDSRWTKEGNKCRKVGSAPFSWT
jgi:hypothetical protein